MHVASYNKSNHELFFYAFRRSAGYPAPLQHLLDTFADLFQEPVALPPSRGTFDHRIPLKEGTSPINLRPYRYPLRHKDIIENLVEEM